MPHAEKFAVYLEGKAFVVRTDHQAMQWLQSFKEPEGQVARWQEQLADFGFKVIHRPGKQHQNTN